MVIYGLESGKSGAVYGELPSGDLLKGCRQAYGFTVF
jgi:hypothetical protein